MDKNNWIILIVKKVFGAAVFGTAIYLAYFVSRVQINLAGSLFCLLLILASLWLTFSECFTANY